MLKSAIFEKVFQNDDKPLLDENESLVAPIVFDIAWNEIKTSQVTSDYESDDSEDYLVERSNKKVEAALIRFERLIEGFKKLREERNDFLKNLEDLCTLFEKTIQELGNLAEELRNMFNTCRLIKGVVSQAWNCVISKVGISSDKGVDSTVIKTNPRVVEKNLWVVMSRLKEEEEKFSRMADWLSCPNELENAINSLLQLEVLREIAQEVHRFQEVVTLQDMEENVFKIRFTEVVGYCVRQMVKSGQLIKEYGDDLAPAVATFIFVVCLMNDDNRILLDYSPATKRMSMDLISVLNFGVLTDAIYGLEPRISIAGLDALSPIFALFGIVFKQLGVFQSLEKVDKRFVSELAEIIDHIAMQFQRKLSCIERIYKDAKDCKFRVDAAMWTTVLVSRVPDDAAVADLKMAVKQYLPGEDLYRVKFIKLPIEENAWAVQVPTNRSHVLSKQTEIRIKGKNCLVNI